MNLQGHSVLRVAYCDHKAAAFAVKHWHYSQSMPCGRLILFGAWEDDQFIGSVIFGRGAIHIGRPFGVKQAQACELVRVALKKHRSPVSQILGVCLRVLKKTNPHMRIVVSFADTAMGHHGGIYQASNWVFIGSSHNPHLQIFGQQHHSRSVGAKYGTRSVAWLQKYVDPHARFCETMPKHKYVFPFDSKMTAMVEKMRKPYPKRAASIDSDATAFQADEGGANPTAALHSTDETCSG